MKKLMIVAALATMTIGASAATFEPIDCEDDTPVTPEACDLMIFKVTGSGKTTQDVNNGDYKAVKTLKITKGALVFRYNVECAENEGICCYDLADLFATVKVGNKTATIGMQDIVIDKWSVFGKDLEKALNYRTQLKVGKTVTLDSDLFLRTAEDGDFANATFEDASGWLETEPDPNYVGYIKKDAFVDYADFAAAAFGSFKVKVNGAKTKVNKGYCDVTTNSTVCTATWTPGTYNGWFVGRRTLVNYQQACFNCRCGDYDVFGGTWKAVFQAKAKTYAAAQKLAFGKTLFSTLDAEEFAEIAYLDDEDEEDED